MEGEAASYFATIISFTVLFQWLYNYGAPAFFKAVSPQKYAKMTPRHQSIACSGICSTANAVIMFATSLYCLLYHDLHKNICWTDDYLVRLLSCVEMATYFSDTLVLLRGNNELKVLPYLFHHFFILLGSYIAIVYGVFAYFICLRGINELSVPFQHIRATLYNMGMKDSKLYIVNGLCFVTTFFFCRVCIIPITIYSVYTIVGTPAYASVNLFCKVVFLGGAFTIDCLNIYWFQLISKGAYKLLVKKEHLKEK